MKLKIITQHQLYHNEGDAFLDDSIITEMKQWCITMNLKPSDPDDGDRDGP
jgi:hypothetical protein